MIRIIYTEIIMNVEENAVRIVQRIILALMLCLIICLSFAPIVEAGSNYNAALAAEYANKWWNGHNPQYPDFDATGQGDCTNFVSQCLYAGGMPMTSGWYFYSSGNRSGSWAEPQSFANYFVGQGYNLIECPSASQVSVGDVILYRSYNDPDRTWTHAAICVGADGNTRYVCAHSAASGGGYSAWTMGYSKYAVIQLHGSLQLPYPGKPSFIGLSGTHPYGEPVTFAWNATANTTHYNYWLYKENSAGEYEAIEHKMGHEETVTSPFTKNLDVGKYMAELQSYNSNYSQNGDWIHTVSDPTYFEVVAPKKYTVSYNANGGTGAPDDQIKTEGIDLILSSTEPTHANGSGSYTVTLNANGGSVSPTSLNVAHTIYYAFICWSTKADGSGTWYFPKGTYSADASTMLYAQWASAPSFPAVDLPTPTRSGYIFKGWATSSDATSGVIGRYCPYGDVTLYAIWEKYDGIASDYWGSLSWTLDNNGVLTISGSGDMDDLWFSPPDAWLAHKNSIVKVVIQSGVTSIGEYAFYECKSLNSVEIPSSVTKLGNGAFLGCSHLHMLSLPSSVIKIGVDVFSGCGFETAGPVGGGYDFEFPWTTEIKQNAFEDCSSLKNAFIPSGVTSISGWAFKRCTGLESITIPASVTSIADIAFAGCDNLHDIYYGGTSAQWNAISIGDNNAPLSSATIHYTGGNLSYSGKWGDLNWSLGANGALTISGSGSMDDFTTLENGQEETRAWRPYLKEIKTLVIENGVTSIGASAFSYCANMISASVPQTMSNINTAAFYYCSSLLNIYVDGGNSTYCDSNGVLFDKNMSKLLMYPAGRSGYYAIPETVKSIEPGAFIYCGLRGVDIPSGVTSIGNIAFYGCSGLLSVVIPESVTSIGSVAFAECGALKDITIYADNIPEIPFGCFMNCGSLTRFRIPAGVTSIGTLAFSNCSSLTSMYLPSGVTTIGMSAFDSCSSLKSITIPVRVTKVEISTFYGCDSLTDVFYGGTEAQWHVVNIQSLLNDPLFTAAIHYNYEADPDFIMPKCLTTIENEAFAGCAAHYVVLSPETMTVGRHAFANCPNLKYIYIHSDTYYIDPNAFDGVTDLTIIGMERTYAQTYAQQKGFTFLPAA